GSEFVPVGGTLDQIVHIDASGFRFPNVEMITMCDIDNPLCGAHGAAAVFAPQKGADAQMVQRLDENLGHLAAVL
ncbi:MAG: glycerate kinase, partial [Ruthenibacterium sp.]